MKSAVTRPAPGADETPRARGRWGLLLVIAFAQFMVVLDTTIVTIALPSIQHGLHMSDGDRQWAVTAYTLAFGGLLLLGGRLADRVGRKRTLLAGIFGFAIASAIGGAAVNMEMLVAARALQGVFAAVLAPSTISLLVITFTDQRERAKAFGIFSAVLISGGALGLVAGGMFTQYLDWRWCLYVNLPIAVLAGVGAFFLVAPIPGHATGRLDVGGAITGCGGMTALVYGLGEAATHGWRSAPVLIPLGAAVVLLTTFVILQSRLRFPLLPLRVIAARNRVGAFASVMLNFVGSFGMFLVLTYQLQGVMGWSPVRTGVAFLPLLGANAVTSTQLVPRLLPRVPPRLLIAPGLLLSAGGMLSLAFLSPGSSYVAYVLPAEILAGIGGGLVMTPSMTSATNGVDQADMGVVSAVVSTSQHLGSAIGTALLNTIAAGVTASQLSAGHDTVHANAHGYNVASGWAVGILVFAALQAVLLINARPRTRH